jgi:DNA-binding MarR family transcriptional regulator
MPSQLEQSVPQALGRLRVAMNDAFDRASLEHGLGPPYAELLCAAMTPAGVGQLAEHLGCDRTNVTRLVDRARQRGWLSRRANDSDRRRAVIELTPEGERLARAFIASLEGQLAELLARWDAEQQQTAVHLVTEIAAQLEG